MNSIKSIRRKNEEEEEREGFRAPAAPEGYFSDLSPGRSSVYSFGMAFYGRLGDDQQSADRPIPQKLQCLEHTSVRSVHIESAHTIILLESGDMLSFGKCHFGQLGLRRDWMEAFSPQHIPLKVRICSIATGTHHSLAVSGQGKVYSWGCGYNGCLGHGDEHLRSSPTLVEALSESIAITVAGGEYHSLATVQMKAEGMGQQVYSWGKGHQGQLGNLNFESQSLPQAMETLKNIRIHKLVAAANFSGALVSSWLSEEDNGTVPMELFTWGSNTCGQLGHSSDQPRIFLPPATVQDISNGMLKDEKNKGVHTPVTVAHPGLSTAVRDDGKEHIEKSIQCRFWTDIASGGHHCLAVDNAGHLFAWGYILPFGTTSKGYESSECSCIPSLAHFKEETAEHETEGVPVMVRVACGTRHSLAFTASGDCFVAGSNSNGQLGLGAGAVSVNQTMFTRLDAEQFQGGAVLTGDGGTNSSVLLVDNYK